MANFYIESVTAKGEGKRDSVIEFSPNLTIIYGASNTGKTYIYKVIDYLFGAKELDIRKDIGYNQFSMVLNCDGEHIAISRSLGDNSIFVDSPTPLIKSGKYNINTSSKNPINKLYLQLMGINEEFSIPSTQSGGTQCFSFRTIMEMANLSETEIESPLSIIVKDTTIRKTPILAHLLYLLYQWDFSDYTAKNKKKILLERQAAVRKFINQKLEQINKRIEEINQSNILSEEDLSLGQESLINDLREIENKISLALKNGEDLLKKINETNLRITECDMLISRYHTLETQLVSDAKRLSFAFESEQLLYNGLSKHTCPKCGEEYLDNSDLYIDEKAIKAELQKISKQIEGIISLCAELEKEKDTLLTYRQEFTDSYELLKHSISSDLQPQKELLQIKIDKFQKIITLQSELLALNRLQKEFGDDIAKNEKIDETKLVFKPIELLNSNFAEGMTENIQQVLQICGHSQWYNAQFDINDMDVILGNQKKGTNGKGYTAFYNSVVFLAFRKFMFNNAKYRFPIQMIDTPLHGLDLGDAEHNIHNMRTGIYECFLTSLGYGQLIIFDNENNMPTNQYLFNIDGVKCYRFTHDDSCGQYGFLLDHRQE